MAATDVLGDVDPDPMAKSSVMTPTMIPASASPRPRSPVWSILPRALTPSQMPAIDPMPPSVRIDSTSDQIAALLVWPDAGCVYAGPARVSVWGLDMIPFLCLRTRS
jgi:hypothetical protein